MEFSEEQVKDALEVRDRISAQIEKHKEEIEMLERNLVLINSVLKQQSFTKASSLRDTSEPKPKSTDYTIPLKKNTDGSLIANAYVTPEQVSIIVEDGIDLNEDSHPFKSFFLERIIGEMKRKDIVEFEKGDIGENSIIDCFVNKDGTLLREIIIKNYRQKERVNEIVNTAAWSFSKMIENTK